MGTVVDLCFLTPALGREGVRNEEETSHMGSGQKTRAECVHERLPWAASVDQFNPLPSSSTPFLSLFSRFFGQLRHRLDSRAEQ